MKKNLMTGIAAAICLGFSSCSKFDFTPITHGEEVYESYETAFVNKFGEPAPEQTWGFGTSTSTRAALTRSILASYNFPSDASSDKFLSEVPEGVEKYSYGKPVCYVDGSLSGSRVELNGIWVVDHIESPTVYITGNVDMTNGYFYATQNTTIYILANAHLKLNAKDGGNLQSGSKIYIASGAQLEVSGELKLNSCTIYNHGTIIASDISPNGNSLLYNTGTLTVSNAVSLNNDQTIIVNDGTITASSLWTAGSSKFQNNGETTVSGATTVNSNDNIWVNNGQYTTGTFTYEAGSSEVINNCKMTVNGLFYFNLGDNAGQNSFRMDAGASCVTESYKAIGPHYIYMGAGALFKVKGTAIMDATKANYGVYGPTTGSGYAVFQAKDIVAGKAEQGYEITYGGNLAVVADTHFQQGYSGTDPYIDFKDGCSESNIYTNGSLPSITIPASGCNPGFTGGNPDPEPEAIRIIAEDLSASEGSDFDFNDVVFDVQLNYPADNQHTITLLAAGGTLPLTVGGMEYEVHYLFGVSTSTMVNTNNGTAVRQPVKYVITGNYSNAKEIEVRVKKGSEWLLLTAEQGKAASKIGVPTTYQWCDEWQDIEDRYPKFKEYVSDPSVEWWK